MDTPSSKNGSYLVIAVGFLALVSLIVGILGLTKGSKLEKQVAELSTLGDRVATAENSARGASDQMKSLTTRVNGLIVDTNRTLDNVGQEMAQIKTAVSGVQKQVADRMADAESRGSARPTGGSAGAAGSGPAPGTLAEDGTYVIKTGDTFGKVAAQFGVTIAEIERANPGVSSTRLRIGQKIVVPKK